MSPSLMNISDSCQTLALLTIMEIKILIFTATLHCFLSSGVLSNKQVSLRRFPFERKNKKYPLPPSGSLSLLTPPYIVPLKNIRLVLLCPAGLPHPQNPRAVAVASWHTVAEMSFFNYVALRGSIIYC